MAKPKKGIYYVVTAYRWGEREGHSYVSGVYDTKPKAVQEAEREVKYRGGKYSCEVVECILNKDGIDTPKTVQVVEGVKTPKSNL